MGDLTTDYLVVGAGAVGLAFTDALVARADVDVLLVDRRDGPGGHWNDTYPFVRLHQPSAVYGVDSLPLGQDAIERGGPGGDQYERARGTAVLDYFRRVLDERLLPTGRVRFRAMTDHRDAGDGRHLLVSRLTGAAEEVTVRRKVVDARYVETSVPATHVPTFPVADGVPFVPVGGLAEVAGPYERYVVLGSGKTAMDACTWLLSHGIAPDRIRWVRPRDAWLLDRAAQQPRELVGSVVEGVSLDLEAIAESSSLDELLDRLEASGRLLRIDPAVRPTMYRCAMVDRHELEQLRQIEDVVRLGHVVELRPDRVVLERGAVLTDRRALHVDCTARGLRAAPAVPMFSRDRVVPQMVRMCSPSFNAALAGVVEALGAEPEDANRLCPTMPPPAVAADWVRLYATTLAAGAAWRAVPEVDRWIEGTRLNLLRGARERREARVQEAVERNRRNRAVVAERLPQLLAQAA